jgi:hypothetical protein
MDFSQLNIKTFKYDEIFWTYINNGIISFQFQGMPENLHLTLAMPEGSDYVNLHVSKEGTDLEHKPRIEIARISKKDLSDLAQDWIPILLTELLTPIQVKAYRGQRRKRRRIYFLSYHRLFSGQGFTPLGDQLLAQVGRLWPHARKRGRLYLQTFPTDLPWLLLSDPQFKARYRELCLDLTCGGPGAIDWGYIWSKKYTGVALHLHGQWYKINQSIDILELFSSQLEGGLLLMLKDRFDLAIKQTMSASSSLETDPYFDGRIILSCKTLTPQQS